MQAATLYSVRECSDVFVDAALRDSSGELLFLSIYGRDTAILHLFASFTLPITNGGLDALTLVHEGEKHRISVSDPSTLDKLTGRLPRGNLFGNLTHAWLYRTDMTKADRVNRSVLALRYNETEDAFATRLWQLVSELCPIPLLDHWREPLMDVMGSDLLKPLAEGSYPPIGLVDGVQLSVPHNFESVVSAAIADGALTLTAATMPKDVKRRVAAALGQVLAA